MDPHKRSATIEVLDDDEQPLMTGRFAIRSGTYEVPIGGVPDGLTQWEITIAELLTEPEPS